MLILLVLGGCGGENSERVEARALLARISELARDAPAATRAERIKRLRALPLRDPKLIDVRDQCALAHAGLLAAELEQSEVRKRMDALEASAARDPSEIEAITRALAHATESLKQSQLALPICEQATRAMAERLRGAERR